MKTDHLTPFAEALIQKAGGHYRETLTHLPNVYRAMLIKVADIQQNQDLTPKGRKSALEKEAGKFVVEMLRFDAQMAGVATRRDAARAALLPKSEKTPEALALKKEVRERTATMTGPDLSALVLDAAQQGRHIIIHALEEDPMGSRIPDTVAKTAREIMLSRVKDHTVDTLSEAAELQSLMSSAAHLRMQELAAELGVDVQAIERQAK
jgi:hypothetical protein